MPFAITQTPQRPLPGAYVATPAPSLNYNTNIISQQNSRSDNLAAQRRYGSQDQTQTDLQQRQQDRSVTKAPVDSLRPVERGARTIDQTLEKESRYPAFRKSTTAYVALTLNLLQRRHLPTMILQVNQHGRHSRRSNHITSRTRCLPKLTTLRSPLRWAYLQISIMLGWP